MRSIKRWTKVLLCIVLALVLLVGAYVVYVFAAYHRIGDQVLTPGGDCGDAERSCWTVLSGDIV